MLSGQWGIGKTFQVKKIVNELLAGSGNAMGAFARDRLTKNFSWTVGKQLEELHEATDETRPQEGS